MIIRALRNRQVDLSEYLSLEEKVSMQASILFVKLPENGVQTCSLAASQSPKTPSRSELRMQGTRLDDVDAIRCNGSSLAEAKRNVREQDSQPGMDQRQDRDDRKGHRSRRRPTTSTCYRPAPSTYRNSSSSRQNG